MTLYASVDLGGTNIKCAFADSEGEIARAESIPTRSHSGPQAVLKRMAGLVNQISETLGEEPRAVGLGIPGLVDLKNGVTKFLPNFPTQWKDVPARSMIEPLVNCPVYLLNDVRMATLGELTFGHGKEFPNLLFFSLGTGIGGGITIDGKLRLGPLGAAAEMGHQTILPEGPLCGCGNRGCMETLASGPAITAAGVRLLLSGQAPRLHELTKGKPSRVNPETMAAAARQGDRAVKAEILKAADYLGIGISNMVTALHPDLVVIGGGVAQMGDLLLDQIRLTMQERIRMIPPESVPVRNSKLGASAGTLGGIALAMQDGLLDPVT